MNNTFIYCNLGCGRVHMGANGCGWGFMGVVGCKDTRAQQNKISRGKMGKNDMFSDPMVGEISPNVMVFFDQV